MHEKWSPQWGFEPTTLSHESSALTTRPWRLALFPVFIKSIFFECFFPGNKIFVCRIFNDHRFEAIRKRQRERNENSVITHQFNVTHNSDINRRKTMKLMLIILRQSLLQTEFYIFQIAFLSFFHSFILSFFLSFFPFILFLSFFLSFFLSLLPLFLSFYYYFPLFLSFLLRKFCLENVLFLNLNNNN